MLKAVNVSSRQPDDVAKLRLDSHAISPVVEYNAYVWRDTGKTIDVGGFTKSLGKLNSEPIGDAIVVYECPYKNEIYLLLIHNALYIKENEDCYVPLFLLREAGITVCTKAKQHCNDPTVENHSIYIKEHDLRIHLNITGIISYLTIRKPAVEELKQLEAIDLTPDLPSWDPYDVNFERREDVMLDFEGNIIPSQERKTLLDPQDDSDLVTTELEDVDFSVDIMTIHQSVSDGVEYLLGCDIYESLNSYLSDLTIAAINPALDHYQLANTMHERLAYSKLGMVLGELNSTSDSVIGAIYQSKPKGITPERLAKSMMVQLEGHYKLLIRE